MGGSNRVKIGKLNYLANLNSMPINYQFRSKVRKGLTTRLSNLTKAL
uniref:Uncharacterized protein n=1 Tax=Myoviridae sp. ctfWc3 TaxID=2827697 RepID=A0A8S5SCY9_9CAUD|nr:MAG TPA: hypothetical protein [Myoviridae sp. ctfWc3]